MLFVQTFQNCIKVKYLLLILLLIPSSIFAHVSIGEKIYELGKQKGPNQGILVKFEENYVEFSVNQKKGQIFVYFIDKEFNYIQIPKRSLGLISLIKKDNRTIWVDLRYKKVGSKTYLEAKANAQELKSFIAIVELYIGDKELGFNVKWETNRK